MPRHSITPIKQVGSIALAREAWAVADYERVETILECDNGPESRLLLARTLIREREFSAAGEALRSLSSASRAEDIEASILRAYIADRMDNAKTPFEHTQIATLDLPRYASSDMVALHDYYQATSLYIRGRVDEAVHLAKAAERSGSELLKAWIYDLIGWAEVERQNFTIAISKFDKALGSLSVTPPIDEHKRINVLHGFGFIALETMDSGAIAKLLDYVTTLPDTGRLRKLNTQIRVHAARAQALLGNDRSAFEVLNSSLKNAPEGPFEALPHIDLAGLHSRRGSADAAILHLGIAKKILNRTNWHQENAEAQILLLLFALECAYSDSAEASRFYAKALNLTGKKDPNLAFDENGRGAALALSVKGRLEASRGNNEAAIATLKTAQNIWIELEYRYRALMVDIDLIKLGAANRNSILEKAKRDFPNSWLTTGSKKEAKVAASPLKQISQTERRVLEGICDGLTSRQIADKLNRSHHTIRNQTIRLYRALGVNSRAALVALVRTSET